MMLKNLKAQKVLCCQQVAVLVEKTILSQQLI